MTAPIPMQVGGMRPGAVCGTPSGYQSHYDNGTKPCDDCRAAQRVWNKRYRTMLYLTGGPRTVDAAGTRRRIQALMLMGWPSDRLGAELAVTGDAVKLWTKNRRVRRTTARRVAELYDRMWDKQGPSTKTQARARAAGWALPLAWDDDTIDDPATVPAVAPPVGIDVVAVERAMRGYPTHLRRPERTEAVRRLTALGLSAAQIAERLGVTKRTVGRQRNRTEEVA